MSRTNLEPQAPPDDLRDDLARAAVDHEIARLHRAAQGLELSVDSDNPDQRREHETGIRLAQARFAYEAATGQPIEKIEIPPAALFSNLRTIEDVDQRLAGLEREDETRRQEAIRCDRRRVAEEAAEIQADGGPVGGYERSVIEEHQRYSSARAHTSARTPRRAMPQTRARERRPKTAAARSSARSGDSGEEGGEPPARRCAACGADIGHRRRDAKTCGGYCRLAKHQGKTIAQAQPAEPNSPTREWMRLQRLYATSVFWDDKFHLPQLSAADRRRLERELDKTRTRVRVAA